MTSIESLINSSKSLEKYGRGLLLIVDAKAPDDIGRPVWTARAFAEQVFTERGDEPENVVSTETRHRYFVAGEVSDELLTLKHADFAVCFDSAQELDSFLLGVLAPHVRKALTEDPAHPDLGLFDLMMC